MNAAIGGFVEAVKLLPGCSAASPKQNVNAPVAASPGSGGKSVELRQMSRPRLLVGAVRVTVFTGASETNPTKYSPEQTLLPAFSVVAVQFEVPLTGFEQLSVICRLHVD